jgi:hypothetical protein
MLYWPSLFNVDMQVLARPDPSLFKSTDTAVFLVLMAVAGMNLDIYTDVKMHIKNSVILLL